MISLQFKTFIALSVSAFALTVGFQNCSKFSAANLSSSSVVAGTSYCSTNKSDPVCVVTPTPTSCSFNGQVVANGASVQAYLSSSPSSGACQPQTRVCSNAVLSGTYAFASCAVGGPASCLFNGATIASGTTVTAYLNSTVAFGAACTSESRTCSAGILSGSYSYGGCVAGNPASCLFNGQTVAHGSSVSAYNSSSVAYGQTCSAQTRTCYNGALSGSGAFASCTVSAPASCLFNGQTIASGAAVTGYFASTVSNSQPCTSETRRCTNGSLSGSATYASCLVSQPAACVLNGQTIASGSSITMYTSAVSDAAGNCAAENRVCTDGTLGGSATASSCVKVGLSGAVAWGMDGCNDDTFSPDPNDPTLFYGRYQRYSGLAGEDPNNMCTWQTMNVALFRADFTNQYMHKIDDVYTGNPTTVEGRVLTTGYDPSVVSIAGTKYVAFECSGTGFAGSVGSCGGPLDANNHLITSQLRVYIDGTSSTGQTMYPSASTPKFTVLNDQIYLSWTEVWIQPSTASFVQIGSRTTYFSPSMPMLSSDSTQAYSIYNPPPNGTADLFSIQPIQGNYYFAGARGNTGCGAPLDHIAGCYHLEVGAATAIAVDSSLDGVGAPPVTLPDNPQEYSRWIYDPNKGWGLLGMFLPKWDGATAQTLPVGLYWLPMSNMSVLPSFPIKQVNTTCSPAAQPWPNYGNRDNLCRPSCGGLGGTAGFKTTCASNSMMDVGIAYDAPYCCAAYPSTCDPSLHPAPGWGVKNNQCLPSCGGIGGTAAYTTPCSSHGLTDKGAAYDAVYCCG